MLSKLPVLRNQTARRPQIAPGWDSGLVSGGMVRIRGVDHTRMLSKLVSSRKLIWTGVVPDLPFGSWQVGDLPHLTHFCNRYTQGSCRLWPPSLTENIPAAAPAS